MTIEDEERGTSDRRTENPGRPKVALVDFKDWGQGLLKLLVVPIEERSVKRLVGDEISISPPKKSARQQNREQANAVLARAKKGKPVSEGEIIKLQQRLLSQSKNDALRGQDESESRRLAEELSEVRRANLVGEARAALEQAERGRSRSDGALEKLQTRLLSMERQDQERGRESEGWELASALAAVRRTKLLDDAKKIVERAGKGQQFKAEDIFKLQQTIGTMVSQEQKLGEESEALQLSRSLGEIRRSQLRDEAKRVLAQAKKGKRFPKAFVRQLQQRLGTFAQQDQRWGEEHDERALQEALSILLQ